MTKKVESVKEKESRSDENGQEKVLNLQMQPMALDTERKDALKRGQDQMEEEKDNKQ